MPTGTFARITPSILSQSGDQSSLATIIPRNWMSEKPAIPGFLEPQLFRVYFQNITLKVGACVANGHFQL
jgi:hypothetical protein